MKGVDILGSVFGRVISLYLALILVFALGMDYKTERTKADLAVLNRLMPTADGFFEVALSGGAWDKKVLREQINYYRYLINVIPSREEAYAILGYCYSYLGVPVKAVQYFQKAAGLNPNYFWPQYNLGVLSYQDGKYSTAADFFKIAVSLPAEPTLMVTYSSRVMQPFRMAAEPLRYAFDEELIKARQESTKLLIESYKKTSNYLGVLEASMSQIRTGGRDRDFFYFHAGLAAYELNEYQKAIGFLQECIKINPEHMDAFHYMGLALDGMGRVDMARQILRREAVMRNMTDRHKKPEVKLVPRLF